MRWLFPFIVVVGACSAEYEVRIRADESLVRSAAYAEVAIVANCLSQEAAGPISGDPHIFYSLADTAPSLGSVPEGNHGLFARFIDEECNVRAVGCQEVEIEGGGTSLTVEMRSAGGYACRADAQCVSGRCVYAADAAVDARDSGPQDASAGDAGSRDASVDAEVDAETDAATDVGVDAAMDAGPADVGVDAPDLCSTGALCDDFESGVLNYGTDVEGTSTVGISTVEAHSGTHSVLVHAAGNTVSATFDVVPFDESEKGERWVRAWYLLPTVFMGISPMSFESGTNAVSLFTTGEDYTGLDTYLFPGEETSVESRIALPNGRWTCIEMHLNFDSSETVELFIDGAPAAEMAPPLPNAFPIVGFGAVYRDELDPADYDIYVDDIAMSTERVGCD